LSITANFL